MDAPIECQFTVTFNDADLVDDIFPNAGGSFTMISIAKYTNVLSDSVTKARKTGQIYLLQQAL